MSYIITAHSCGGSMAEAANPIAAIGTLRSRSDATQLANLIYEHASQHCQYDELLTCVVEVQDYKDFIVATPPPDIQVGEDQAALDVAAIAKAMFGHYYD